MCENPMRKKIPIWIYSVPAFNRLVDFYFRHRTACYAVAASVAHDGAME